MSPQDQTSIQKVALAGMKLMYDPKTFPIFSAGVTKRMTMSDKLATETAGIMKMLEEKATGSIPKQILLPAALVLMLDAAKFMEDTKVGAPSPQDIKLAYAKLIILLGKIFVTDKRALAAHATGSASSGSAPPAAAPTAPAPGGAPQTGILGGQ